MSADDIIVGKKDQQFVLDNIHERTDARYTFNENNELIRDNSVDQKSDAYSDKIDQAIKSDNVMEIKKQDRRVDSKIRMEVSIDYKDGGGVTTPKVTGKWNDKGEIETTETTVIMITGRSNNNLKDSNGNSLEYRSSDILLHEIVGHGLSMMGITGTGNAVENENMVRQALGLPLRKAEKHHHE